MENLIKRMATAETESQDSQKKQKQADNAEIVMTHGMLVKNLKYLSVANLLNVIEENKCLLKH